MASGEQLRAFFTLIPCQVPAVSQVCPPPSLPCCTQLDPTPQRGSHCTPATSAHTVENTLGSSVQNAPVFLSSQLSGFGRLKEGNCGIGK